MASGSVSADFFEELTPETVDAMLPHGAAAHARGLFEKVRLHGTWRRAHMHVRNSDRTSHDASIEHIIHRNNELRWAHSDQHLN